MDFAFVADRNGPGAIANTATGDKMISPRLAAAAFALLATSLAADPARAAVVTVHFEATITENGNAAAGLPGFAGLAVGQAFSGSFFYDLVPDVAFGDAVSTSRAWNIGRAGYSFSAGPVSSSGNMALPGNITVRNNWPDYTDNNNLTDLFEVVGCVPFSPPIGGILGECGFSLLLESDTEDGTNPGTLDSVELPTQLDLSMFELATLTFSQGGEAGGQHVWMNGFIAEVTSIDLRVVPEPGTLLLFGAALAGLGMSRRVVRDRGKAGMLG
jgi:hypothetical protein